MFGKRALRVKPHFAVFAFELSQIIMYPEVFLEAGGHNSAANVTRPLLYRTVVIFQMGIQILLGDELFAARAALETFNSVVVVYVSLEVLLPHESLVANLAVEW